MQGLGLDDDDVPAPKPKPAVASTTQGAAANTWGMPPAPAAAAAAAAPPNSLAQLLAKAGGAVPGSVTPAAAFASFGQAGMQPAGQAAAGRQPEQLQVGANGAGAGAGGDARAAAAAAMQQLFQQQHQQQPQQQPQQQQINQQQQQPQQQQQQKQQQQNPLQGLTPPGMMGGASAALQVGALWRPGTTAAMAAYPPAANMLTQAQALQVQAQLRGGAAGGGVAPQWLGGNLFGNAGQLGSSMAGTMQGAAAAGGAGGMPLQRGVPPMAHGFSQGLSSGVHVQDSNHLSGQFSHPAVPKS